MKIIKNQLSIFFCVSLLISSCITLDNELLNPSNNHLYPKLPYLEIMSNGAGYSSELEFNTEEKLNSLFKNEFRKCIVSENNNDLKGYIKPIIKSTTEEGGFGVAYLTGFTLGTLNLLGMPYGNFTTSLNVQVLILDKKERIIWERKYSASKKVWAGFYYNALNQSCVDNTSLRMMKNILNEVRNDIDYNKASINEKL